MTLLQKQFQVNKIWKDEISNNRLKYALELGGPYLKLLETHLTGKIVCYTEKSTFRGILQMAEERTSVIVVAGETEYKLIKSRNEGSTTSEFDLYHEKNGVEYSFLSFAQKALGWENLIMSGNASFNISPSLLDLSSIIINGILKVEKWHLEEKCNGKTSSIIN